MHFERRGKDREDLCLCALKGSDSTCLRRLGLSPGSIFAVLFGDPVDFGGEGNNYHCENLHLQSVNCPICPPVWSALRRYTIAACMRADRHRCR